MKRCLPPILTLLLLIAFSIPSLAQAINPDNDGALDVDDESPVSRVARLSFVQGDVSFLRAGVTEWAPVVENLPLLAGDQLYAGRGARAEIQLGRSEFIRLSENTALTINSFSDTEAQFDITEGTATFRIERLSSAFHRFEVDTPNTAVLLQQDGIYRVDVRGEDKSELMVNRGDAEASTDEGTFKVHDGHRLVIDTSADGKLELVADESQDAWDQWSHDRDAIIDREGANLAPDYVASYETTYNDFYGASDLSSYGTWTTYSSYGQCWIPRVGSDWAPYRQGQWLWIPSAGWTWLSSEPWGWAPYHYGRWAYLSGIGWAWIPGFGSPYPGYGYWDYRWRPALVCFFNSPTPRGNYIGWYPLAPGERWHKPDRDRRGDDHHNAHKPAQQAGQPMPIDGGGRVRPPRNRGVTILPIEGFASGDSRLRPAVPGKDLSDWISKGARAGLPEIKPTPVAVAPALNENDRRRLRRIAVPPTEIVNRSVVTRNQNADASSQLGASRERRFISPRGRGTRQTPALIEPGTDRGTQRRSNLLQAPGTQSDSASGVRPSAKFRQSFPTAQPNDSGSAHELKRTRQEPASQTQSGENASGDVKEKRRIRSEAVVVPKQLESRANKATDRRRDESPATQRNEPKHEHVNSETRERPRQEQSSQKEERKEQQRLEPRKKT